MDNNIKLIITDDAAEFSQENLKVLQDFYYLYKYILFCLT